MSKGEILAALGEGKYRVKQDLATERIEQELASLNERIAELAVKIPERKLELLNAQDSVDDLKRDIDFAIADLQAGEPEARKNITALQVRLIRQAADTRQIEIRVNDLISENLAALKRRGSLERIPEGEEVEAWCADYTESLSGDVGLIDVNDEGGKLPIIQPGYSDGAAYDQTRDGALFPTLAQTAEQLFLNTALLPGVQKWRPRYRAGVISDINSDTCSVLLDDAVSSAQDLPINQQSNLTDVPIQYMDCNGAAFSDGDRVVVRFTASGPLVVGFEKEPVPCSVNDFICRPGLIQSNDEFRAYGKPFEETDGTPINPPLGTFNSNNDPCWTFSPTGSSWSYQRGLTGLYGLRNWAGTSEDDVLSWRGPASRVCAIYRQSSSDALSASNRWVYYKDRFLIDISTISSVGTLPVNSIEGAAITYNGADRYLRLCLTNTRRQVISGYTLPFQMQIIDFFWPATSSSPNLIPTLLAEYESSERHPPCSGAYFSRDGKKCVLTRMEESIEECYVMRWSEGGGITESHEEVSIQGSGLETYENTGWQGSAADEQVSDSLISSGYMEAKSVTLYYDYQGNSEIRVTVNYPAKTTSVNASGSTRRISGVGEINSESRTERVTEGTATIKAGSTILLSVGPTYQFDASSSASWNFPTFSAGGEPEGSGQILRTDRRNRLLLDAMHIDARSGIAFAEIETYDSTYQLDRTMSGSQVWNNTRSSGYTSTARAELWVSGSKVASDSKLLSQDTTNDSYGQPAFSAVVSDDSYTNAFTVTPRIGTDAPCINNDGDERIIQGSFCKSGGRVMAAFEMKPAGAPAGTYIRVIYMTGSSDPVGEFLQRSEGSRHTFSGISLI